VGVATCQCQAHVWLAWDHAHLTCLAVALRLALSSSSSSSWPLATACSMHPWMQATAYSSSSSSLVQAPSQDLCQDLCLAGRVHLVPQQQQQGLQG
jgi:hypothetical protein